MPKGKGPQFNPKEMQALHGIELIDYSEHPGRECHDQDLDSTGEHRFFDGDLKVARNLCAGCVIVEECGETAVFKPERHGFYGGMTEAERERARKFLKAGIPWEPIKAAINEAGLDGFPDSEKAKADGSKTLRQRMNMVQDEYGYEEQRKTA